MIQVYRSGGVGCAGAGRGGGGVAWVGKSGIATSLVTAGVRGGRGGGAEVLGRGVAGTCCAGGPGPSLQDPVEQPLLLA